MYTQEEAYIEGFVKRAHEYGFSSREAIQLLKQADESDYLDAAMFDTESNVPYDVGLEGADEAADLARQTDTGMEGVDEAAILANQANQAGSASPSLIARIKQMLSSAGGRADELGGRLRAGGNEMAQRLRNVDPRMAAGAAGGAALLGGGGYLLKKKMDKDRAAQRGY
jgi:hypothetical protein